MRGTDVDLGVRARAQGHGATIGWVISGIYHPPERGQDINKGFVTSRRDDDLERGDIDK